MAGFLVWIRATLDNLRAEINHARAKLILRANP